MDQAVREYINKLKELPLEECIHLINEIKKELHKASPFKGEPVDCVLWVKNTLVKGNDYNPNSVAPPEMQLLECSIAEDGYTQPIVAWNNASEFEIVDGFHRHRVGKEAADIKQRIHGYLPLTIINAEKSEKSDRIASTIRHNRARGKHSVDAMSEIVIELKKRNWTKEKIAKHLGMDTDEILRLTQISGLVEMFKDEEFSNSWDLDMQRLYADSDSSENLEEEDDTEQD